MRKRGKKAPKTNAAGMAIGKEAEKPSLASKIYCMVPDLPLLERSGTAILFGCTAAYLIFVAYVFLITPPVEIKSGYFETELQKNAGLSLAPGEEYVYQIPVQGKMMELAYSVSSIPGCSGVVVTETYASDTQSLCLRDDGRLANAGEAENDFGYGNKSLFLFSPWMLAASENFTWKAETIVSAAGTEMRSAAIFTSVGEKAVGGRRAYAIEIRSNPEAAEPELTMYIDAEKRVLVMAEGKNSTIRLVRAPFALDWNEN